jgi:hypothetical protein
MSEEEILCNKKLVLEALRYYRGCKFHYEKALVEMSQVVENRELYLKLKSILQAMQSETNEEVYVSLDTSLLELAKEAGHHFMRWLEWWRDAIFGARFKITHSIYLSTTQRLLSTTTNPQEGLHRSIKEDFFVKATPNFLEGGKRFKKYIETAETRLNLVEMGYTPTKSKSKKKQRTQIQETHQPLKSIDKISSPYELTFGVTKKKIFIKPRSFQHSNCKPCCTNIFFIWGCNNIFGRSSLCDWQAHNSTFRCYELASSLFNCIVGLAE